MFVSFLFLLGVGRGAILRSVYFILVCLKRCKHILSYIKSHLSFSCALLCPDRDGEEKGMFLMVVSKLGQ